MTKKARFKDRDMQAVIGWVLRLGVIISIFIVFIGGVIYLWRHGHEVVDHHTFKGVPEFISTFHGIFANSFTLHGQAIIQLGIALLIATPILRIIFSTIGFALEKDKLYVFVSLLVLAIIFASMLSGHAG
ncbi:MAG: DUF1634 domain-containing protein [Mucilaginibacter sp.]